MQTFHINFFGCKWLMKEKYQKHWKTLYLTTTYNNAHFAYQVLWVYMAHEEIISETLKNYLASSNTLQKKNLYDLTCNFGQLQKDLQCSRFPVLDTDILSPYLSIPWHTYGHHIFLFHYMYKFNCFCMKFTWYITIYTCLSKTTWIHTLYINFFGCKCPMKTSYQKHWKNMLYLAITHRKITSMI